MPTPPTARRALDAIGMDAVYAMILRGMSQRAIAAEAKCDLASYRDWLAADPLRSARALEARQMLGQHWDEQAQAVLEEAEPTKEEIARANALAQHFRWRAAIVDPKYRPPQKHEHEGDLNFRHTIRDKPMSTDEFAAKHNVGGDDDAAG